MFDGQRLSITWLAETFDQLPDDANDTIVHCFTQAYIMHLLGRYLLVDRLVHKVSFMYLSLLEDFEVIGQYSWGSDASTLIQRNVQCDQI